MHRQNRICSFYVRYLLEVRQRTHKQQALLGCRLRSSLTCRAGQHCRAKLRRAPPQETHYPELPPAPSLMEVKDLVALSEQHMRTPPFSKAWDSLRTCLPCLYTGRTQFSTALKALRYPFKRPVFIPFQFFCHLLPPPVQGFPLSRLTDLLMVCSPSDFTSSLCILVLPSSVFTPPPTKCSVRSWLTFLQRKCSRQEKYEVTGNPKNDWDRTRKMGSHGSSLIWRITYRRMQELRPCGLFGLWHLYNNKPTG